MGRHNGLSGIHARPSGEEPSQVSSVLKAEARVFLQHRPPRRSLMDVKLRQFVRMRAGQRCEYCGLPQEFSELRFHIDAM